MTSHWTALICLSITIRYWGIVLLTIIIVKNASWKSSLNNAFSNSNNAEVSPEKNNITIAKVIPEDMNANQIIPQHLMQKPYAYMS